MQFEIDFMPSYDEASIIAELRRIARETGKRRITSQDINKHGRINATTVAKKFGLLRHALVAAGLTPSKFTKPTDEEVIGELAKLWVATKRDHGRSPLASDVTKYGLPFSENTACRQFGTWNKALAETARVMNASCDAPIAAAVRPTTKRMDLSVARRFDVFKRDAYRCRICKKAGGQLEVDHIVPVAKGGTNAMDNLQTVCWRCNRGKGTKLM